MSPYTLCRQNLTGESVMEFKVANFVESLYAFFLVVKNYQSKGYLPSTFSLNSAILFITRFCVFVWRYVLFKVRNNICVIVAKEKGKVIGTVSLEFNSSKLCIDKLFPNELKNIRSSGKSFVYFGSFAISSEYSCSRTSMRMLKEQWRIVKNKGTEIGLCVVNPVHSSIYQRFGFKVIATQENMPGLSQAPAVLLSVRTADVVF